MKTFMVLALVGRCFGGLKSCLSTWKPFGLGVSPQDFQELSTGFSPGGAMRGFAMFDQIKVGETEACPATAGSVEGKTFTVLPSAKRNRVLNDAVPDCLICLQPMLLLEFSLQ